MHQERSRDKIKIQEGRKEINPWDRILEFSKELKEALTAQVWHTSPTAEATLDNDNISGMGQLIHREQT